MTTLWWMSGVTREREDRIRNEYIQVEASIMDKMRANRLIDVTRKEVSEAVRTVMESNVEGITGRRKKNVVERD